MLQRVAICRNVQRFLFSEKNALSCFLVLRNLHFFTENLKKLVGFPYVS